MMNMASTKKTTPDAGVTSAPGTTRAPKPKARGIEKEILKSRPVCRVTFRLPKEGAPEAETVCVMGEVQ